MNTYRIELDDGVSVLSYQLKVAEACLPEGVIVPKLAVEQDKRAFIYDVTNYSPVFAARVSKEDVLLAEKQYSHVCDSLANTLLEPDKLLYSDKSIYRDSEGRFYFLYYPAEPVGEELKSDVLARPDEGFIEEAKLNSGIRDVVSHVGFAVGCYCIFAILGDVVPGAVIVAFVLYVVLCLGYHFLPRLWKRKMLPDAQEVEMNEDCTPEPICFSRESVPKMDSKTTQSVARLTSLFDQDAQYDITDQQFLIGRNINLVHLYIPDNQVNPIHAEIGTDGEDFFITDKCSRNGTYVNGTKIEPEIRIPLYGTEEIRVGQEVFLFTIA